MPPQAAPGPAQPDDPFDLLNLPARFDLDRAAIQAAYLARVTDAHPDRAVSPTAAANPVAPDTDALSARLNRARETLADPERRADALVLRLHGPSRQQDRSLPDGFLMQMMEVREQIDAELATARASTGSTRVAEDDPTLAKWLDWADARRDEHIAAVKRILADIDGAIDQAARLRLARRELNAWRYIERLVEQLTGHEPMESA